MLKTSHISAAATSPSSAMTANTGSTGNGWVISNPTPGRVGFNLSRLSRPPPVMWASPCTGMSERSSSITART